MPCVRAIVFFGRRTEFNEASALTAYAVFEAVALPADIEPPRVFLCACSDVLGHDLDQLADLFIQPLRVNFKQQAALAYWLALDQHSSIESTEHFGRVMLSFSPSSLTPL